MSALFDSDQLRTFIAIVETGSFTRAAEVVHKTQSAVSMQMKRLEERTGRSLFERDGRATRLTEDGERLLDYARRIVKLNTEAMATFSFAKLTGRVRLGVPDDYADRYLPEILVRFSRTHPAVEVSVICEPTAMLLERVAVDDIDLAIITHMDSRDPAEIVRVERLLWVTSGTHAVHEEEIVPLALGRPVCCWRDAATSALDGVGRAHRVLYSSWSSNAVGAAVLAGLAVSVLPESAIRSGMRILAPADGYPALPPCKIGLVKTKHSSSPIVDMLARQIAESLDNLTQMPIAAE